MSTAIVNPAPPEVPERLIKLWNDKNVADFKKEAVALVTGHEDYFKIMDLHSGSGSQQTVTRGELVKYFSFCFSENLCNALFSAIAGEKDSCSVVSIRVFFHGRRTSVKQKEIVKDAKWLWETLQHLDLKDIDDDENLRIEREELRRHFQDELDVALIDAIFDSIDADQNGHITPMEYFRWRHNSKLSSIQKLMHKAHKSLASPGDYVLEPIVEAPSDPEPLLIESNPDRGPNKDEQRLTVTAEVVVAVPQEKLVVVANDPPQPVEEVKPVKKEEKPVELVVSTTIEMTEKTTVSKEPAKVEEPLRTLIPVANDKPKTEYYVVIVESEGDGNNVQQVMVKRTWILSKKKPIGENVK